MCTIRRCNRETLEIDLEKGFLKPHFNTLKYAPICDFTRCFQKLSVEESSGVAEAAGTIGTRPNHIVASSILLFW